jgi:prepilin-type N-terminal cleavage/methylation domain-containing protein
MNSRAGFTLLELLIVLAIIGILTTVVVVGLNEGTAQARDAERQADLRNLQSAVERYKTQYGRYPAGCNGANSWSGQPGTDYECTDGSRAYILGYEAGKPFVPNFIEGLPLDPKLNGTNSGYMYLTNADGSSYKIMVKNTVESETVTRTHEFKSCDIPPTTGFIADLRQDCDPPGSAGQYCDPFICYSEQDTNTYAGRNEGDGTSAFPACYPGNSQFDSTYAVWGGWSKPGSFFTPGTQGYTANQERLTEAIWCET